MTDRDLVTLNVRSRHARLGLRVSGYILFFSVLIIGFLLKKTLEGSVFVYVGFGVLLISMACARFFREIEILATSEIELRKLQGHGSAGENPSVASAR